MRWPIARKRIPTQEFAPAEVGELDLYQKRERIYTRKVEGFYQRLRLYQIAGNKNPAC